MPELAKRLDGIPLVTTTAERGTLYPSPATGQRVQNLQTAAIERWTGTAWVVDVGSNDTVDVRTFGAVGDGSTDDTAAIEDAITAANGKWLLIPDGTYIVDTIVTTGISVRLTGSGTLKHKASATGTMLSVTGTSSTAFAAHGIRFDGNRTNQSARRTLVHLTTIGRVDIQRCTFTSSVAEALFLAGTLGHVTVDHNEFTDMAEHGGTLNETSFAMYVVGTSATLISATYNRVIGNTPVNPDRAAGAFFVNVSNSAPCDFLYNYFERVGQREATNVTGCIDAYTNGGRMTVVGNRAVMCYYTPWKLQVGDEFIVRDNRIEEVVDTDVTVLLAVLQNARDHAGRLKYAVIEGNFFDAGSGNNPVSIFCQGDADYHSDGLLIANNVVSRSGTFAYLQRVQFSELRGNIADGLVGAVGVGSAIVIEETSSGAGAPTTAVCRIVGGRIDTAESCGVFARTNITNLDVEVSGVEFVSWETGNPCVTVRDAKSARVLNNTFRLAQSQLDLQSLDYAKVDGNTGNTSGTLAIGAGVTSVDYGVNPAWDFTGAATFNPGSIASGSREVTTVTVTGASTSLHDAEATFSNALQGLILSAWVSSADTVSVCFFNPTSGSIDLASGTLSARAIRRFSFDT